MTSAVFEEVLYDTIFKRVEGNALPVDHQIVWTCIGKALQLSHFIVDYILNGLKGFGR